MTKQHVPQVGEKGRVSQPAKIRPQKQTAKPAAKLQNPLSNRAIQRLLAQRSSDGAFDLDDATANRINQACSGGQALDGTVQTQMSESMGTNFSGVRVHTSSEAHALNEQLSAKAFTTGHDIFFRAGEYNPDSSSGQELIAHELTHVVQQGSGVVGGGGAMRVNPPGDQFEQEADSVAKTVTTGAPVPTAQRQELPEEEEDVAQMQELPEDELAEDS